MTLKEVNVHLKKRKALLQEFSINVLYVLYQL